MLASQFDKALQAIKHALTTGRWQPGQALSIRTVAEELGLSVAPVRDAFNELVTQGVLEQRAGVGTRVANPSLERLAKLWKLRALLEGQAACWLAERANKVALAALMAEAEAVDEIMFTGDSPNDIARPNLDSYLPELNEAEDQFHRHFVESADSSDLLVAWKLCHFLLLMPGPTAGVPGLHGPGMTCHRHKLIMEAVSSGDPGLAEQTAREHVLGVDEAMIRHLNALADQGLEAQVDDTQVEAELSDTTSDVSGRVPLAVIQKGGESCL